MGFGREGGEFRRGHVQTDGGSVEPSSRQLACVARAWSQIWAVLFPALRGPRTRTWFPKNHSSKATVNTAGFAEVPGCAGGWEGAWRVTSTAQLLRTKFCLHAIVGSHPATNPDTFLLSLPTSAFALFSSRPPVSSLCTVFYLHDLVVSL